MTSSLRAFASCWIRGAGDIQALRRVHPPDDADKLRSSKFVHVAVEDLQTEAFGYWLRSPLQVSLSTEDGVCEVERRC